MSVLITPRLAPLLTATGTPLVMDGGHPRRICGWRATSLGGTHWNANSAPGDGSPVGCITIDAFA